jgi:hypothetical protein
LASATGWVCIATRRPKSITCSAGIVSVEGEEIPVKAGSAVFIPGMAKHGVRQTGNEILRFFYAFPVDSFDGVEYLFDGGASG